MISMNMVNLKCLNINLIPWLLRRISSEEKGNEISQKKIKIKKNWNEEEYQVVGNFLHFGKSVLLEVQRSLPSP